MFPKQPSKLFPSVEFKFRIMLLTMSKTLTDNQSKVIAEQDTIQLFQDNPKAPDIKEHKMHQNRLAQRTYRENIPTSFIL